MRNVDPRTKYPRPPFAEQPQEEHPGLTEQMHPEPDHGERSYRGSGKLSGQRASGDRRAPPLDACEAGSDDDRR